MTTYKVTLIGDEEVGKTSFLKRHTTGDFIKVYEPTVGIKIVPIKFHTNYGVFTLNVWDYAGRKELRNIADTYYDDSDAAIIMFDKTNKSSYKNVEKWYKSTREEINNKPIVICGNKADCKEVEVKAKDMTVHHQLANKYGNDDITSYIISAKSCFNFEKPFLFILRKITKHDDLVFVESPKLTPPEI